MRILVVTDLHANLRALQAILKHTQNERIDMLLSLGDQVNYGPWPKETLSLLRDHKALMLLGNHEMRLKHLNSKSNKALETQYNWSLLRFTHAQLKGETYTMPQSLHYKHLYFTHAIPDDLFYVPNHNDHNEFIQIAKKLPTEISTMLSGHNHHPWHQYADGKTFINPGSAGVLEGGSGLQTSFLIIDDVGKQVIIEEHCIGYDANDIKKAYIDSGAAAIAPEFSRLVLEIMLYGSPNSFSQFISETKTVEKETNHPWHSQEAFHLASNTFPWQSATPTDMFFR